MVQKRIGDLERQPELRDVRAVLGARDDPQYPVSRRLGDLEASTNIGYTVGAAAFSLTTAPVAHIAAGPPCSSDFVEFEV